LEYGDKVGIEVIKRRLDELNDGLMLAKIDLEKVPLPEDLREREGYRATLGSADAAQLILWDSVRDYSKDRTGRLSDVADHEAIKVLLGMRLKNIMDGDPVKGRAPLDLRTAPLEVFLATNSTDGPFLVFDGLHRLIGQQLSGKDLQGAPAFVIVHPNAANWENIRAHYKNLEVTP
jgi:hypothetical protein